MNLENLKSGDRIKLPAGVHICGKPGGVVALPRDVWITGEPGAQIQFLGTYFIIGEASRWSNLLFDGLCWFEVGKGFYGTGLRLNRGSDAFVAKGDAFLQDCTIEPSWDGISIQTGGMPATVHIERCTVSIPPSVAQLSHCVYYVEQNSILWCDKCVFKNQSTDVGSVGIRANAGVVVLSDTTIEMPSNQDDVAVAFGAELWLQRTQIKRGMQLGGVFNVVPKSNT